MGGTSSTHSKGKNEYTVLVGKCEVEGIGGDSYRREDNIKRILKVQGTRLWITWFSIEYSDWLL
jgi:hypothetical protein